LLLYRIRAEEIGLLEGGDTEHLPLHRGEGEVEHQVKMHSQHKIFLGLSVQVGGRKRMFRFRNMQFGYQNASRVFTRVLRGPYTDGKRGAYIFISTLTRA
jgi:hypothetical protein